MSGGGRNGGVGRDATVPSADSRAESPRFESGPRPTEREFATSGDVPIYDATSAAVLEKELPVAIGDVIAGKYQVERVLGRGGAGIVVAARNLDLDERVALKFLRPDVAEHPEVVARFAREAKAAVSIKNEHVCKVLDVGALPNGAPFMVMEYLEGRDLYRVLRERGALPITEAAEYVLQVCEALALAHARGIVHRDVKPENIFLIEPKEGLPYVKVLDFGISKSALTAGVAQDSIVKTSALLGTPAYMSPEQIRATTAVDARSDIWALGVVLYELISAKPAFTADSVPQMAAAILEQEPESIRRVRTEVPAALAALIGRCLSKDRNKRPRDVAELATALLPFAPRRSRISVERAASVLHKKPAVDSVLPPRLPGDGSRATLIGVLVLLALAALGVLAFVVRKPPVPAAAPPPSNTAPASAATPQPSSSSSPTTTPFAPAVVASPAPSSPAPSTTASIAASTVPTPKTKPVLVAKPPPPKGSVDLGF